MINIIYGLRDPRNDTYQYIGKSTVVTKRALSHLTKSHSIRVNEWVATLEQDWLYPIIDIIEEVSDINELPEREKYWIEYYSEINPNLFNIQLKEPSLPNKITQEDEDKFHYLSSVIRDLHLILRKERLCRGITQEEFSKEMGIARSTLSLLERGENVYLKYVIIYIQTLKKTDIISKMCPERAKRKNTKNN